MLGPGTHPIQDLLGETVQDGGEEAIDEACQVINRSESESVTLRVDSKSAVVTQKPGGVVAQQAMVRRYALPAEGGQRSVDLNPFEVTLAVDGSLMRQLAKGNLWPAPRHKIVSWLYEILMDEIRESPGSHSGSDLPCGGPSAGVASVASLTRQASIEGGGGPAFFNGD